MSLRYYMNLVEALSTVPPTVEPTTTPEDEQTTDEPVAPSEPDMVELSEPAEEPQRHMLSAH